MKPGYRALRDSAAWLDLTGRGKIAAAGPDARRLLHALASNHIEALTPGGGCYTFFLDAQGHILADAHILCRETDFLIDTEPETAGKLLQHLDRYIIADDVTLEDWTSRLASIGVEGPLAEQVLAGMGAALPQELYAHTSWDDVVVSRTDTTGSGGFLLFAPEARKPGLVHRLEEAGVPPATPEDALAVRLENGKPRYGPDITGRNLPQETQAPLAVHYSKGCYLGQEIVERVRSQGKLKRLLTRLEIDGAAIPPPGTQIAGGVITSAALSPGSGKVFALAFLPAAQAVPGALLSFGAATVRVLEPYSPATRFP